MRYTKTSLLFYGIRLLCVFSPGYIHPDEFFQAQEVIAHKLFNTSANIPWEFSLEDGNLYRSMLPIFFSCGIPYLLTSFFFTMSPHLLWLTPRIFLFALSLGKDRLVWRIAEYVEQRGGCSAEAAFFVHQTSWVTLVFSSRPFSNTLEAMLVTLCFYVATQCRHALSLLGALYGCGVFTRVTFPVFVVPLTLYKLGQHLHRLDETSRKRRDKTLHWKELVVKCIAAICRIGIGFCLSSIVNIVVDTVYVRLATGESVWAFRAPTIAPLNNLLYNVDTDNLSKHGLHPWYLHAAVNMQVLFGPLWLVCLRDLRSSRDAHLLCGSMILTALVVLSLIPHQEMRFLVPLLLPISLFCGSVFERKAYRKRLVWVTFNGLIAVFYGFVHQAGIVPLVLAHAGDPTRAGCIYAYETYMIPHFLYGQSAVHVHNLKDYDEDGRTDRLLRCQETDLLLPATALPDIEKLAEVSTFSKLQSWWPHFCGERLGNTFNLELYRIIPYQRP